MATCRLLLEDLFQKRISFEHRHVYATAPWLGYKTEDTILIFLHADTTSNVILLLTHYIHHSLSFLLD